MPATLTIREELLAGGPAEEWSLEFLTETVTVRELIRGRVYQEVQDANQDRAGRRQTLVRPEPWEERLNGLTKPRPALDWKRQFAVACEAFEEGRVLILLNERQAESLDETVTVAPGAVVTFLKLTPLVGG